ncbi:MAG: hypothetical protein RL625_1640 [Gemmatimonadota bacterium]|jgi:polysaccharide export outer membrane protein
MAQSDAPLRSRDRFRLVVADSQPLYFSVDEAGFVTVPLAGSVRVAGLSPAAAARAVQERYAAVARVVDVGFIPLRRVVVGGEVMKPDVLYVENGTTLAEAIVLAGGATLLADKRRVELWRDGARRERFTMASSAVRVATVTSGDEIVVQRAPWVARNANVLLTVVTSIASVAVILITSQ